MFLKEIDAVNFKQFGAPITDLSPYQSWHQTVYEDDIRTSSSLWHYETETVIEAVSGVGLLFVRTIDGKLQKFLLDQTVIIKPNVQFCALPWCDQFTYRLYSHSPKNITPTPNVFAASGFTPDISAKVLYTVLYQEKDRQFSFRGEEHPFWEFTYVNKGNMICEVDSTTYELKQGQMMFFAPYQFHRQRSDGKSPLAFLTITFDGNIVQPDHLANRVLYADESCLKIIQNIMQEERDEAVYGDDMILCDLTKLLITTVRNTRSDSVVTRIPTRLKVTVDNAYISECIDAIHQNISSSITLPWLAKQLNLSPSYLSSLFKQKVGRSISEYIRLVRLEKVKDMISEGRYTIAQISDIMGYCSPTYLSTEFKREYDMSPKEYAKMLG